MRPRQGNVESVHGLAPMQEGILFHSIHAAGAGLYVEQYTCQIDGPLEPSLLERAWHHVVHRHGALRSLFTWEHRERPLQVVKREVAIPWLHQDWRSYSSSEREQRLAEHLHQDRALGFDLESPPLLRIALFQTSESSFRFVFTFHHLILDGWSLRLVLQEVLGCYRALLEGRPLPESSSRPYRDYLAWLETRDLMRAESYWRRALAGCESPTRLGIETTRTRWAAGSEEIEIQLDHEETRLLLEWSRSHRLTLSNVLRGAWGALLSRYSGETDVIFGATVSGRPAELDGAERMVGLFINTIPVRMQIGREDRVVPWLQTLQREQSEASEYDFAPLVLMQRWSEVREEALLHSLLVFQNVPPENPEPGHLTISRERYHEQSNFPIALLVFPGPQLLIRLVYDRDRYTRDSMEQLAGHFRAMIRGFVADPRGQVGAISLLSSQDRSRLEQWNQSALELPPETRIEDWIARTARTKPEAPALVQEGRVCTYAELAESAGALSERLRAHGVENGGRVTVALDRSIEMIVGILGILESGCAYVPVDPEQPIDRTRFVMEDVGSPLVVTVLRYREVLAPLGVPLLFVDQPTAPESDISEGIRSDGQSVDEGAAGDLAYVIYTSGSTGAPKGVEITHSNLIHSTAARQRHYQRAVERFCLTSPFIFDSSVAGIFWTLVDGGTLVLPSPGIEKDMGALAQVIEREAITHILTLPSLYALLLEHAPGRALRSLKTVIVAGEACPPEVPEMHFRTLPHARLYNEYGPTEATVWSTVYDFAQAVHDGSTHEPSREAHDRSGIREPSRTAHDRTGLYEPSHAAHDRSLPQRPGRAAGLRTVPIGRPIPGMSAHVLDRHGRQVPIGAPGELYLGGPGIARGYLHRPDLTAERFVTVDLDESGAASSEPDREARRDSEGSGHRRRLYRTGDRVRYGSDGNLEFLGRVDDQVKVRGHRIELGEIESALRRLSEVREAAVVLNEPSAPIDGERLGSQLSMLDRETALRMIGEIEALTDAEAEDLLREA